LSPADRDRPNLVRGGVERREPEAEGELARVEHHHDAALEHAREAQRRIGNRNP
jgi:hypothetical protein